MRPLHPNLRAALAAKDSPVRTLVEAQSEQRSDVLKTKTDLQSADGFTARSADFPSANSLTAHLATTEVTLANAPAANALYEAHFRVTITPIVPGAGTNSHKVVVALETDPVGTAVWTEQWSFEYEVIRKVGEVATAVVWPSERLPVRVTGFSSSGKVRLKIKVANGPGGWSFAVHGFNLATDGDLLSGVTYHTGPAIDFLDGGGATLADVVLSKISLGTADGYELDLGGPALSPEQAPFIVARTVWGKDDSRDIAIDRFTAQLHPKENGANPKDVVWFICQPYALSRVPKQSTGSGAPMFGTEYLAELMPLCDPVRVPAGDGTTAQDYVFSFYDRSFTGPGHSIVTLSRKPRPKSIQPNFGAAPEAVVQEHDHSPTTFWFIWAVTADGTPATNVGWARDSAVTEVVNGSRKLRTVRVKRLNDAWMTEGPSTMGATPRPTFRCKIECGSYAAANLEYTAGGNQLDLAATPTETVEFAAVAAVPDGTGSVFEVRNDADSAWLEFKDGQTAAEVGVSQREEYKVRWRGSPNSQGDGTPTLWEIGVRDVKKVWLSDLIASVKAKWSIPNVADLVPSIPEAEIVLIKNGERDFNDRVTKLLSTNTIGSLAFRIWRGDPARPRAEWLHKDDFTLIDDYDPRDGDVTVIAHSPLVFVNGALPVYNTTTQEREPLQLTNKTPKQVYAEIVNNQLAPDIPSRYRGEGLIDESCLISQTLTDSDGLIELNAIHHIAGCVLSTSAGKLKSFPMFGPGAVQAIFPSEKIRWRSTSPGLRQRVPRFFVRYNYDLVSGQYGGEARLISGNDILATNLKPSRIDAVTTLRDDVCRWIPIEELAKRVGQRRVDTLGAGMLVWPYHSTEQRPDLEFGDVVAVETARFFERDPSQVAQRTLKGNLWALARVVEYDIEGQDFGVWIQSHNDIFGGSDVATRLGFAAPDISSLALSVSATQQVTMTIGALSSRSVRYATSTSSYQSQTTTEAGTLVALDASGNAVIDLGALATLATMYVTVIPFENADGSGAKGVLRQAQITAQPIPPTIKKIFLTSGTSWTVPGDFNVANNTIEAIGGGGGGAAGRIDTRGGGGGGGGEYRKISNFSPGGATVAYVIGQGGVGGFSADGEAGFDGTDTTFNVSSLVAKKGLGSAGAAGGTGGTGGTGAGGNFNGGTGGGAAVGTGDRGGGGGGGSGGTTAVGGTGTAGSGANGGAGGAGGATSGGAGGAANSGTGGAGTVWTSNPGGALAGSGGGGGGDSVPISTGGLGGLYGGGGGGGAATAANFDQGGDGQDGIIVITYTTA